MFQLIELELADFFIPQREGPLARLFRDTIQRHEL